MDLFGEKCVLKRVIESKIEGKIKGTGRRIRRHKQLLDDLKETRVSWKLKEEALDRTVWRTLVRLRHDNDIYIYIYLRSKTGSVWDFRWTQWQWDSVAYKCFGFLLRLHAHFVHLLSTLLIFAIDSALS